MDTYWFKVGEIFMIIAEKPFAGFSVITVAELYYLRQDLYINLIKINLKNFIVCVCGEYICCIKKWSCSKWFTY